MAYLGNDDSPSLERITGWTHLYREHPFSEVGEGGEGGLGEVDVLRVGGAAGARIDDADENTLGRLVAHWWRSVKLMYAGHVGDILRTLEELEALGFGGPPVERERRSKRLILVHRTNT